MRLIQDPHGTRRTSRPGRSRHRQDTATRLTEPEKERPGYSNHPAAPAALIGQLAIATTFRGRKLGSVLLSDAVARAASADLATFAMVTDPKDATARRFYEHHGFTALRSTGGRMFVPTQAALGLLRSD
jgi:GNAT superfamily N-acetyltransferase